jgi:quercetin dioxygenase-like cupin family protein
MKKIFVAVLISGLIGLTAVVWTTTPTKGESPKPKAVPAGGNQGLKLDNLLTSRLEGAEGIEVIISRVTIPANTSLPKHWHPGEEFAYILEGSVVLWQKGKADVIGRKGEVVKVPLKQIHTAMTKDEGATILVFRVHEQGKPERIKVD